MTGRPRVHVGDITTLDVDVVVNAANPTLLGGGGVDGAIHRAAGPELKAYCATIGGCPTGKARLTPGFGLSAPWIIHTVGPVWRKDDPNQDALLGDCYSNSLELAHNVDAQSIAFPSISTGVYGFPADQAARIAVSRCKAWLEDERAPQDIILCCFPPRMKAPVEAALAEAFSQ